MADPTPPLTARDEPEPKIKTVIIQRMESGDEGTFGILTVDDLKLHTAELPYRDNKPMISCIPAKTYRCEWIDSPRFKRMMYLVLNVEGRSGIRFHSANFVGDKSKDLKSQVLGCIALGLVKGRINNQSAILSSRSAMKKFEGYLGGQPFNLTILPHDKKA